MGYFRLPESEYEDLRIDYLSNPSLLRIQRKYNIGQKQVKRILSRLGVEYLVYPNKIPDEDAVFVVYAYLRGYSTYEIEECIDFSRESVRNTLRRYGIKAREHLINSRKHPLLLGYFKEIDTQCKAYILGLVTADGCLHKSLKNVSITVKSTDIDILEKVKHCMGYEKPIPIIEMFDKRTNKTYRRCTLNINSKLMVSDLLDKGLRPAKSLEEKPYLGIIDTLKPHYLRGIFDGDGWISRDKKQNSWGCGVCGSKEIINYFYEFITSITSYIPRIYSQKTVSGKILWSLRCFGKENVVTILDKFYSGSELYLDRKYNMYMSLKKELGAGKK